MVNRYINSNPITSIPTNAFTGLTALTELSLLYNQITGISAGTFTGLTALTALYFASNQITSIPADAFTGLTALTHLSLQYNQITSISGTAFTSLTALTYLSLQYNQITSISGTAFTFNLTALTYLSLDSNQITSIPVGAFTGLTALTYLSLYTNQITSISVNAFTGLTALASLVLQNNQITSIPAAACTGLPALTELSLGINQITSIPADAFTGLTALTYLSVENNQITSIPAGAFTDLAALTDLHLDGNQITSIPDFSFTGLTALTTLALQNNPITTLPPGLFKGLPNALALSLSYPYLAPNNFTFGDNNVAPPSTYGSASQPYKCDTVCATCYAAGSSACCETNCLYCTSSSVCTQCYDGSGMLGGSCVPFASIASVASTQSASAASVASLASATSAISASFASLATASSASIASTASASVASLVSASSALSASVASTASASAASVASSIAQQGDGSQESASSSAAIIAAVVASVAVIALIVVVFIVLRRRRSQRSVIRPKDSASPVIDQTTIEMTMSPLAHSSESPIEDDGSTSAKPSQKQPESQNAADPMYQEAEEVTISPIPDSTESHNEDGGSTSDQKQQPEAKDSSDPIYQEADEVTTSPQNHSAGAHDKADIPSPAAIGQQQSYQAVPTAPPEEVVDDDASAYVAGSNSRRVREGLTIGKHLASGEFGDVSLGQVLFNVLPTRARALLEPTASPTVLVAVKSSKADADEKSRQDFEAEAKLMAPFVHPNVVRLLAALVESEPHLVLLEFVQYGDLRTLLQKSQAHSLWWTHNEQIHAIRQIALGMEYLGTLHFVHRDLAARNCLVGQGMVVKIADFGLSRELTDEQDYYRMQTRGKLPVKWMAPETMTFRKFSSMSDVWSFGVTAWECSSYGAMPYGKMNGAEALAHVEAGGRPSMPEHCSTDLFILMLSCWNSIPELRPSFTQLVKALTNFEDGTAIREIGALL
ncbi:tyrosine-protein kinase CSK [Capsaspora owczarzaki ATCC 30864]|uniref:tyrosine-protein kinase CSK n=1 Tax=Capsaspora owczarzaki (strain ATCC 30864) TaxID=595528 RepID=UPI0001FE3882|nr:tyrosine-protein kinase CSK [Capsaspora owczarzaki ATCC 30864]|eukprot:XP_004343576.1 tyrosine-protein kinase CSK [Capsaspora owczarzaki ATCC 30864]